MSNGLDANLFALKIRQQEKSPRAAKKETLNDELETSYTAWKSQPAPYHLNSMLTRLNPTIDAALTSYAGGTNNALARGRARRMTVDAITNYKPAEGSTLKGWVSTNLQGLRRYTAELTPFTAPERMKLEAVRMNSADRELSEALGRPPTDEEIADRTGINLKRMHQVRTATRRVVSESSFEPDGEDDNSFIPGVFATDWRNVWAEYVYKDLDPTDKLLFDARLGRGRFKGQTTTGADLSKLLRISQGAVSQRARKIADKLSEINDIGGPI